MKVVLSLVAQPLMVFYVWWGSKLFAPSFGNKFPPELNGKDDVITIAAWVFLMAGRGAVENS